MVLVLNFDFTSVGCQLSRVVMYNSVAETEDEYKGIDTQHLQTLEKLKQTQRLEHQRVRYFFNSY